MNKLLKLLFVACFLASSIATSETRLPIIELTPTNSVNIKGVIDEESISKVQKKLSNLIANRGEAKYPLYIVLMSPGGSVEAGLMLYEQLKAYKNIHTITIKGYSMAALLVELNPGKRYIVETGELMFHRVAFSSNRPQNPDQAASLLRSVVLNEEFIKRKVSERSGISVQELAEKMAQDWWVGSAEALERNLADEVVIIKCNKELLRSRSSIVVQPFPFLPPITVETADCPLAL